MSGRHSISEVSRLAGIPKDLLRMWERRYGCPKPMRDSSGARIYSNAELDKLIAVRRLVEQGRRPGKLMPLDLPRLRSLLRAPKVELDADHLLALLGSGDVPALRGWLQQQLSLLGLRRFIHEVMAPATRVLGDAWAGGGLEIYQEHLFTETITTLVRQALSAHYREDGRPRVMLTTVQGEPHGLGLLMVEALLRVGGAEVIPFGTEMPIRDISNASARHKVDVVGLSFSCHFRSDEAMVMLDGLRQRIDAGVRIWAGGCAFGEEQKLPAGVELFRNLHEVERALSLQR